MGAVTDVVKRIVPSSYRAMIAVTNSYYSASDLQGAADYVKFKLFGTSISAAAEVSTYDLRLLDFLGKLTTLQFIPAAVDFWGDQLVQESTTGTNETVSYLDRREGLWKIFDDLRAEVQADMPGMQDLYGFAIYGFTHSLPQVSYGDNGQRVLRTADPHDFPPMRRGRRLWGDMGLLWLDQEGIPREG